MASLAMSQQHTQLVDLNYMSIHIQHITLYLAGSGLPAFQHCTRKTGEPGKSYHVSDVEVNGLN